MRPASHAVHRHGRGDDRGVPQLESCRDTHLDGDGKLGNSFEAVRRHLRTSRSRRMLVGAINDPSALGALRAFQEAGRAACCAIMGQNPRPKDGLSYASRERG